MEEIRLPVFSCVTKFEKICRIGEGTYGVVCKPPFKLFTGWCLPAHTCSWRAEGLACADKARNRETGEVVALKKVRMERERDGTPLLVFLLKYLSCVPCQYQGFLKHLHAYVSGVSPMYCGTARWSALRHACDKCRHARYSCAGNESTAELPAPESGGSEGGCHWQQA